MYQAGLAIVYVVLAFLLLTIIDRWSVGRFRRRVLNAHLELTENGSLPAIRQRKRLGEFVFLATSILGGLSVSIAFGETISFSQQANLLVIQPSSLNALVVLALSIAAVGAFLVASRKALSLGARFGQIWFYASRDVRGWQLQMLALLVVGGIMASVLLAACGLVFGNRYHGIGYRQVASIYAAAMLGWCLLSIALGFRPKLGRPGLASNGLLATLSFELPDSEGQGKSIEGRFHEACIEGRHVAAGFWLLIAASRPRGGGRNAKGLLAAFLHCLHLNDAVLWLFPVDDVLADSGRDVGEEGRIPGRARNAVALALHANGDDENALKILEVEERHLRHELAGGDSSRGLRRKLAYGLITKAYLLRISGDSAGSSNAHRRVLELFPRCSEAQAWELNLKRRAVPAGNRQDGDLRRLRRELIRSLEDQPDSLGNPAVLYSLGMSGLSLAETRNDVVDAARFLQLNVHLFNCLDSRFILAHLAAVGSRKSDTSQVLLEEIVAQGTADRETLEGALSRLAILAQAKQGSRPSLANSGRDVAEDLNAADSDPIPGVTIAMQQPREFYSELRISFYSLYGYRLPNMREWVGDFSRAIDFFTGSWRKRVQLDALEALRRPRI